MERLGLWIAAVQLLQCRPIDLSEGWSMATDSEAGVIAKIVCQCGEAPDSRQASLVVETLDIRATCAEAGPLCQTACTPSKK